MRPRLAASITFCLLLGAVAQYLLAAGLSLWAPVARAAGDSGLRVRAWRDSKGGPRDWGRPRDRAGRRAEAFALQMWPELTGELTDWRQEYQLQYWERPGITIASGDVMFSGFSAEQGATAAKWTAQRYAAGWPVRSTATMVSGPGRAADGLVLPMSWASKDRSQLAITNFPPAPAIQAVVPLRPLPLGTAINTLVFASPPLAVIAFRAARTAHRRKHSLCVHCGYNRSDLPREAPCSECGTVNFPNA